MDDLETLDKEYNNERCHKRKKDADERKKRRHVATAVKKQLKEIALDVTCAQLLPSTSCCTHKKEAAIEPSSVNSENRAPDLNDYFETNFSERFAETHQSIDNFESSGSISDEPGIATNACTDYDYNISSSDEIISESEEENSIEDSLRQCRKYEYAVVEFVNEIGQIAVIPKSWIKCDSPNAASCYWPPFRNSYKLTQAIISQIVPERNWETHNINIMRKSRSYQSANRAATYYEKNIDIDMYSTDENSILKKNNKIPLVSSDDSEYEFEQLSSKKQKTVPRASSVPSPPDFPLTFQKELLNLSSKSTIFKNCNCSIALRGLVEKMLKEMESMKIEISQLRQENTQKISSDIELDEIEGFPLTSIDDLLTLNETLTDNETFSKLLQFAKWQTLKAHHKQQ